VKIVVDIEELKRIEREEGIKLKRLEKAKVKWLEKPDWKEKTYDALVVEVPEALAYRIFEKYRVKALVKEGSEC